MIINKSGVLFDKIDDVSQLMQLISNFNSLQYFRAQGFASLLDTRRDYDLECGYKKTAEITISDYMNLYMRNPVAARVVELFPLESWQVSPEVYEDENPDELTEFEDAWLRLSESIYGESWFNSIDVNHPIWEILLRADIQSGIGSFGLVVIGIDDGLSLEVPAKPSDKPRKLLYLSVYNESHVQNITFETNPSNPRFNKPLVYEINPAGYNGYSRYSTFKVHYTRVIHIAEFVESNDVLGVPRMRPVYDRLIDLTKLYGASAEGYWRGAFPGLALETHPSLGSDVSIDYNKLKREIWDYFNGLQRSLALIGMSAKSLSPQVVDPSSQIDKQIEAICIKLGVPKRIFIGSERGELASSQDETAWKDRLRDRRLKYITPKIIVPLIDRLIWLGALPKPTKYRVEWPDPDVLRPSDKAELALKTTEILAKYISGKVDSLILPLDFLTKVLEFDEDEAKGILERAQEQLIEEQESLMQGVQNVFCPTGKGGGIDPTCSPGGVRFSKTEIEEQRSQMRSIEYDKSKKKWVYSDTKEEIPKELTKGIGVHWINVKFNPDPNAVRVAEGYDKTGRYLVVLGKSINAANEAAKYARARDIIERTPELASSMENDINADGFSSVAGAALLILRHGIRPGGRGGAGGKGALDLDASNVVVENGNVRLEYVPGKKRGQLVTVEIEDRFLADSLVKRKNELGGTGKLFNASRHKLASYVKKFGEYKIKDFRTAKATKVAIDTINAMPAPKTMKEYKKAVKYVADVAAKAINDTRAMALKSYIDPAVFSEWRSKLG